MSIGILRNSEKPSYLTNLIAIYSSTFDFNIIYLTPKDINIVNGKVKGKLFVNGQWVETSTDIPNFIDVSPECYTKERENTFNVLRKYAELSDNGLNYISALDLLENFNADKNIDFLVMPVKKIVEIESINEFLKYNKCILLRPSIKENKQHKYIVSRKENIYEITLGTDTIELDQKEFIEFFQSKIKNNGYFIHKHIKSELNKQHSFDCYINLEKNETGSWTVARKFIRMDVDFTSRNNEQDSVIVSDFNTYLKSYYQEDLIKKIKDDINTISTVIPQKIESYRKQELMSLGIKLYINDDGSIFLYEIDYSPVTVHSKAEIAMHRSEYFNYIEGKIKDEGKR